MQDALLGIYILNVKGGNQIGLEVEFLEMTLDVRTTNVQKCF
jgi:hypothetical protein